MSSREAHARPYATHAPSERPSLGPFARARRYLTNRVDPLTSLFLVLPLYVIYQVGVLLQMRCGPQGCTFVRNGVDFITNSVLSATNNSRLAFGLIAVGVGLALGVGIWWARRRSKLHPRLFIPVLLESALYATLLGPAIIGTQHALGLGVPGQSSLLGEIIASCGAGLHEELIFRAVLFAGGAFLLKKVGMRPLVAVIIAALASSMVFSGVHYLGSLGEEPTLRSFVFRTMAGLIFAAIYGVRGFGIAAWTHCLYDVWVSIGQRVLGH